jgi:hypothetical protein
MRHLRGRKTFISSCVGDCAIKTVFGVDITDRLDLEE